MATNKLVLLAALFAASVAFAAATTYTTVVTTTVNDDRGSSRGSEASWEECQQELQQIDPNRCQQYFTQGQQWLLRSAVGQGQGQQEQSVQECCETIRQARPECRCHAIQHTLQEVQRQQQGQGQGRGREQQQQEQQLRQKAERLPQLCRFQQPSQCSFNSRSLLLA